MILCLCHGACARRVVSGVVQWIHGASSWGMCHGVCNMKLGLLSCACVMGLVS